jgi:penicillin amidase
MMGVFKALLRAHWLILLPVLLLVSICWFGSLATLLYLSVLGTNWTVRLSGLGGALLLILGTVSLFDRRPLVLISVLIRLRLSLPSKLCRTHLPALGDQVTVTFDRYGVPTINSRSRVDAFRVLGYLNARDRLFQMDLLRKQAAGKLAELFGPVALRLDITSRELGFSRVAEKVIADLPAEQQAVLLAYSDGVNAFMTNAKTLPFEFRVLRHRPDAWTPTDSLLVLLQIFRVLSGDQKTKRMLTVMDRVLPPEIVAFLTPDFDVYSEVLLGNRELSHPKETIPVGAFAALFRQHQKKEGPPGRFVQMADYHAGSNCWAIDKSKTANGHAMLANDIHLELGVPNIWYRARVCYEGVDLSGVMVPGMPAILVGSNAHVAWGVANIPADCLDLIEVEINPKDPSEYKTATGWRKLQIENEVINIKGGGKYAVEVAHTIWGPLCAEPLLGERVALHWSALDGVNLEVINIDTATGIEEAARIMNHWFAPPLNVLIADHTGRIAYTVCGRFPVRRGGDGAPARCWDTYVPPEDLPRLFDPPEGQLVVANNRTFSNDYPLVLGRNFCNSYRAHRSSSRLREMQSIDETDLFKLQLDSTSEFYGFYNDLALSVLTDSASNDQQEVRMLMTSWDGTASVKNHAFALLVAFREQLAFAVFEPLSEGCRVADPQFVYCWRNFETPLRLLLTRRIAETLPYPDIYPDWDSFILARLLVAAQELKTKFRVKHLDRLKWGRVNEAAILHPFASALPRLRKLLNMPNDPLPGCAQSICVSAPTFGATLRMVVSPNSHAEGILQMPCGQSGHPLSPHYDDQHRNWIDQVASTFLPGPRLVTLIFSPDGDTHGDEDESPSRAGLPQNQN